MVRSVVTIPAITLRAIARNVQSKPQEQEQELCLNIVSPPITVYVLTQNK